MNNKAHGFNWSEASASRIEITDMYEPIQPWLFLGCLNAIGVSSVLDVGANIGFYSLISTVAPSVSRVFGFEAAPKAAAEFRKNVKLNSLGQQVTIEEMAVSDGTGTAEFLIASELSGINALADTTMHRLSKYSEVPITVSTVTLDDWSSTRRLPPGPIGMKIDVEGAEGAVFRGAKRLLLEREVVLQVEMYQDSRDEDATILKDLGYELLLRCSNDWFWTNSLELVARWRDVVETAMTNCVRWHMKEWPPLVLE